MKCPARTTQFDVQKTVLGTVNPAANDYNQNAVLTVDAQGLLYVPLLLADRII